MKKIIWLFLIFILIIVVSLNYFTYINKDIKNNNNLKDLNTSELSVDIKDHLVCLTSTNKGENASRGTGYIIQINSKKVILTAGHVLRNKTYYGVSCDYNEYSENSLKHNDIDLGVIKGNLKNYQAKELVEKDVSLGDKVFYRGYYKSEKVKGSGVVTEKNLDRKGVFKIETINKSKLNGISGGPIYNTEGNIIGTIIEGDSESILAVNNNLMTKIIKDLEKGDERGFLPKLPLELTDNTGDRNNILIIDSNNRYYSKPRIKIKTQNKTIYKDGTILLELDGQKFESLENMKKYLYKNYGPNDEISITFKTRSKRIIKNNIVLEER